MSAESAVPQMVIPGIAEFARGGLPDPPSTDDGNHWVDGLCWLYCGQRWTRVLWIGPASVAGAQAAMYGCGPCIRELQKRVWRSILGRDKPEGLARLSAHGGGHEPTVGRSGRHRRVAMP